MRLYWFNLPTENLYCSFTISKSSFTKCSCFIIILGKQRWSAVLNLSVIQTMINNVNSDPVTKIRGLQDVQIAISIVVRK